MFAVVVVEQGGRMDSIVLEVGRVAMSTGNSFVVRLMLRTGVAEQESGHIAVKPNAAGAGSG